MAKAHDYIPSNAADFVAWAQNLLGTIGDSATTWCLTSDQVSAISTAVSAASAAVANLTGLAAAYHAGVDAQNAAIAAAVALIRVAVAQIQACPTVTDAMRATAQLPVHDTTRTPNPPPATLPILNVSSPLHGTIRFVVHDSAAPDSHSHAKPAGYQGFELYEQIGGTPPVTSAGMTPLNIQTKTSFTFTEDPANSGKTFYYLARWVNTTGQPGPWSAVASVVLS